MKRLAAGVAALALAACSGDDGGDVVTTTTTPGENRAADIVLIACIDGMSAQEAMQLGRDEGLTGDQLDVLDVLVDALDGNPECD